MMLAETGVPTIEPPPASLTRGEIEAQFKDCPALPSLTRNTSELLKLLDVNTPYSVQICEIIRRDPSLTARLLRLVNSVYYGLARPVDSIEEAVFFVGIEQVRQLAMLTPVIEDFQKLAGKTPFPWHGFWQHCIATAMMTREVIASVLNTPQDVDYVAGLVHDVGKIVMAAAFPGHFTEIHRRAHLENTDLLALETEILGLDHAEIGAFYLQNQNLPVVLVETARFHHHPELATENPLIVAAVQVANLFVRHAHIGFDGRTASVGPEDCSQATGWNILYPRQTPDAHSITFASLEHSLQRIPVIIQGYV